MQRKNWRNTCPRNSGKKKLRGDIIGKNVTINGNADSLKASVIAEIEALYGLEYDRDDFLPGLLAEKLASLTGIINREIAVYMDRKGHITDISIGDSGTVELSEISGRRNGARRSGIRCIHTHPNGSGYLSAVDINSMKQLNLDAIVAVGVAKGRAEEIYAAVSHAGGCYTEADIFGPFYNFELNHLFDTIYGYDKRVGDRLNVFKKPDEKAVLVGLELNEGRLVNGKSEAVRSLEELAELARTAGLTVLEKVLQKRPSRDAAFYIGRGKIDELSLIIQALGADTLVFDDELSGAQTRNIEELTGAKVVDRTTLILDIFAQRARSSEGKLQVELAQLKYRLPRLTGLGGQLSRLGGGIGTRGPGEKKLETDRRHIRRRINRLEKELASISKRRGMMREGRKKEALPVIALVGYTNSGKSTLLNRLCDASSEAENKLFATLDPMMRRLVLPDGRNVLVVDTVGFIRKLPHELVEAFKSTLEEIVYADVLLHIADASDDEAEEHTAVADEILGSIGAGGKPAVLVLNKMDLVKGKRRLAISDPGNGIVEISAATGRGVDKLLERIEEALPVSDIEMLLLAPYGEGWISPYLHEHGKIFLEEYTGEGIRIRAKINRMMAEKVRKYAVWIKLFH